MEDAIEEIKKARADFQIKIDEQLESKSNSAVAKEREAQSELRSKKSILINEKHGIRNRLNELKAQTDRLLNDRKSGKQTLKFTKMEDIEEELRKLKIAQETTSMSLSEEKRLIKEIDSLQASKKVVAQIKGECFCMA